MVKAVAVAVTAAPAAASSMVMNLKETVPLRPVLTFISPKGSLPSATDVEGLEKIWMMNIFLGCS